MNSVYLIGRLTRDPDVRKTERDGDTTISARYTLAVDRRKRKGQEKTEADFVSCVAFGKAAEFLQKYCRKGTKIAVHGAIRTGSYIDRDGQKVYTTQVVTDEHEFCEPKKDEKREQYTDPYDQWAEDERRREAGL